MRCEFLIAKEWLCSAVLYNSSLSFSTNHFTAIFPYAFFGRIESRLMFVVQFERIVGFFPVMSTTFKGNQSLLCQIFNSALQERQHLEENGGWLAKCFNFKPTKESFDPQEILMRKSILAAQ